MKSESLTLEISETRLDELHEVDRAASYTHAGCLERLDLFRCRPRRPGYDGTRMPHPSTWRRCLPCDEADDRLLHVLFHELRRILLVRPADLAHQRHGLRIGILLERR